MRYRIIARTVVTLDDDGNIFSPGQITWDGEYIVSVGSEDSDQSAVDQLIRIDTGMVMPGLYNGHNHAAMTLLRGYADDSPIFDWLNNHIWPAEAKMTPEDIYIGTLAACAEMIHSGTVGFADMYFETDQVARAVALSGLRAWISRGLIEVSDPGHALDRLDASVDFAQRWKNQAEGRIVPMLGPHAPYTCTPEYLEAVARAAYENGLGIQIHLAESAQEVQDIQEQWNMTPIALAKRTGLFENRLVIAHGVHVQPEDVPYLQGMTGGIISCPVSNAKLGNGVLPYAMLRASHIAMGLGTDGAASTNTLDMFREMKALAWLQKLALPSPHDFQAKEALMLATKGSAQILGSAGGMLEAGRPADLIVLDGDQAHLTPSLDILANIVYSAVGRDVLYTIVAGNILMAEGVITAFNEADVLQELRQRSQALVS
ncbi:MAG: amidohydrolase [Firmicutes bacterium]|nr:amidohydrolase [Bacillota bacterium]